MGKCKCLPQRMLQREMKANSICISSITLDVFPLPFRLEFTHTCIHVFATELFHCQLLLPRIWNKSPFTHKATCQSTSSTLRRQRKRPGSCDSAEPCHGSRGQCELAPIPLYTKGDTPSLRQDLHLPPATAPGQHYGPISQIKNSKMMSSTTVHGLCFYVVHSKISVATYQFVKAEKQAWENTLSGSMC